MYNIQNNQLVQTLFHLKQILLISLEIVSIPLSVSYCVSCLTLIDRTPVCLSKARLYQSFSIDFNIVINVSLNVLSIHINFQMFSQLNYIFSEINIMKGFHKYWREKQNKKSSWHFLYWSWQLRINYYIFFLFLG